MFRFGPTGVNAGRPLRPDHAQTHGRKFSQPLTRLATGRLSLQGRPCVEQGYSKENPRRRASCLEAQHLPIDLVLQPVNRSRRDFLVSHGCFPSGCRSPHRRARPQAHPAKDAHRRTPVRERRLQEIESDKGSEPQPIERNPVSQRERSQNHNARQQTNGTFDSHRATSCCS